MTNGSFGVFSQGSFLYFVAKSPFLVEQSRAVLCGRVEIHSTSFHRKMQFHDRLRRVDWNSDVFLLSILVFVGSLRAAKPA